MNTTSITAERPCKFEDARQAWQVIKAQPDFTKLARHHGHSPFELLGLSAKHGNRFKEVLKGWGFAPEFYDLFVSRRETMYQYRFALDRLEKGALSPVFGLLCDTLGPRGQEVPDEILARLEELFPQGQIDLVSFIEKYQGNGHFETALAEAGFRITHQVREYLAREEPKGPGSLKLWFESVFLIGQGQKPFLVAPHVEDPPGSEATAGAPAGNGSHDVDHEDGETAAPERRRFGLPPADKVEVEMLTAIREIIIGGIRELKLSFPEIWAVWRYGILSSPIYRDQMSYTVARVCVLLKKARERAPEIGVAEVARQQGVDDERLLVWLEIFWPAIEYFGKDLDAHRRDLEYQANPPTWEDLQRENSFTKLNLADPAALFQRLEESDNNLGKAFRDNGVFVASVTLSKIRYFLMAQGITLAEPKTPTRRHLKYKVTVSEAQVRRLQGEQILGQASEEVEPVEPPAVVSSGPLDSSALGKQAALGRFADLTLYLRERRPDVYLAIFDHGLESVNPLERAVSGFFHALELTPARR